jgi:hypothetical protein
MMTHSYIPIFSFIALLAAAGCSKVTALDGDAGIDGDSDSDTDTDTDTDTGVDLWQWSCGIVLDTDCSMYDAAPLPYTLALDLAAAGLTGIHASRSATLILAERETADGPVPVVAVWRMWTESFTEVGLLEPPAEPLRAVAIASENYTSYGDTGLEPTDAVLGYPAVALLCGETACALYGVAVDLDAEPIGLAAIPGGEVPLAESRALAWIPPVVGEDVSEIPGLACVAGDGVNCFDGVGWIWAEPPAAAAGSWNAIDAEIDDETSLHALWVAGADGRIATNHGGDWTDIDSGTGIDFVAVSARAGIWAAGGAGGFVFGDGEHVIPCFDDHDYTAMFVHESYEDWTSPAVTALSDEAVFEIWGDEYGFSSCVSSPGYTGAPLDADLWPFITDMMDGYALTAGGLYLRTEYSSGPGK